MSRKIIVISIIIPVLYILLGAYDYYTHSSISVYVDKLYDDLYVNMVFPSKMFGVALRNFESFIYDSDLFFILGQLLGLIFYGFSIWIFIVLLDLFLKKIKK